MKFIEVTSHEAFLSQNRTKKKSYLLLYKSGAESSRCAYENIKMTESQEEIDVFSADVNSVRDIHEKYGVTSVPALLSFENGEFKNIIKGCNPSSFYKSLFDDAVFLASNIGEGTKQPSVTVYSTPSCSWCTRLKDYLKQNNIKFRDIDVSKDQKAADEMVKRSGQQGVPQSLIGGQVIVGFDKAKIDQLLGLKK